MSGMQNSFASADFGQSGQLSGLLHCQSCHIVETLIVKQLGRNKGKSKKRHCPLRGGRARETKQIEPFTHLSNFFLSTVAIKHTHLRHTLIFHILHVIATSCQTIKQHTKSPCNNYYDINISSKPMARLSFPLRNLVVETCTVTCVTPEKMHPNNTIQQNLQGF